MLADKQTLAAAKADFDRDGFAVIRNYLSDDQVQKLYDELQRYIRDQLPTQPCNAAYYEDKNKPQTLFRLDNLQNRDTYFRDLPEDPKFKSFAEMLLDDEAVSKVTHMFAKAPNVGNETPPHQDAYYWKIEPNEGLTIWLPLDRTDETNGCIRYVPGSHKRGLLPHDRSEVFGFSQGLRRYSELDSAAEVAICANPGDLIAHHGLTFHRADRNLSDRRRWAVGLVYYASRAKVDAATQEEYTQSVQSDWKAGDKI